ncbi:MAG: hypothetical protein IJ188_06485 [Clostridia bacterium]|nr:hypothetical protein [Clostridia bacterium]
MNAKNRARAEYEKKAQELEEELVKMVQRREKPCLIHAVSFAWRESRKRATAASGACR